MKYNKSKSQILHLGWNNTGQKCKLGEEWLESSPAKRNLGVLLNLRLSVSGVPGQPHKSKPHPGVHQTQHD